MGTMHLDLARTVLYRAVLSKISLPLFLRTLYLPIRTNKPMENIAHKVNLTMLAFSNLNWYNY